MKTFQQISLSTLFLIFSVFIFSSCSESNQKVSDTYKSGKITVAADESYMPIMKELKEAFENTYPNASINLVFTSQEEAIGLLMKDSARVAIVERDLNAIEIDILQKRNGLKHKKIPLAVDGVSVVINKNNPDSTLTLSDLRKLLSKEIKNWSALNAKNKSGEVVPVFDNPNSSNLYYIAQKLDINAKVLQSTVYSSGTNQEVIKYITANKGGIGFVGVNWVTDLDSKKQLDFNKGIRVAMIAKNKGEEGYQPYQAYLKTKQYLLTREMNCVTYESRQGLGSGFINFCVSEVGQRIVLKSGLLPANAPVRIISLGDDK